MIRLYEIPKESKVYFTDESDFLIFKHIDGMYSYCEFRDEILVHLFVNTPLEPYLDGYKIIEETDE